MNPPHPTMCPQIYRNHPPHHVPTYARSRALALTVLHETMVLYFDFFSSLFFLFNFFLSFPGWLAEPDLSSYLQKLRQLEVRKKKKKTYQPLHQSNSAHFTCYWWKWGGVWWVGEPVARQQVNGCFEEQSLGAVASEHWFPWTSCKQLRSPQRYGTAQPMAEGVGRARGAVSFVLVRILWVDYLHMGEGEEPFAAIDLAFPLAANVHPGHFNHIPHLRRGQQNGKGWVTFHKNLKTT